MVRFKKYLQKVLSIPLGDANLVCSFFQMASIPKNEYLIQEGKICRHLNFIEEGVARYKRREENGDETTCFFVCENDFVGDPDSFFPKKSSVLNAQAVTDMSVVRISYDQYEALKRAYPGAAKITADIDHITMKNLLEQRDFLMNKDAETRYRQFMEKFPHLLNRVPLQFVASFLDIAQPSLSRLRRQII